MATKVCCQAEKCGGWWSERCVNEETKGYFFDENVCAGAFFMGGGGMVVLEITPSPCWSTFSPKRSEG